MSSFSIAAMQLDLPRADNRERIEKEIATVMARFPWVQMVLLPELCSFGAALNLAEPMPGPTEELYREIARKHRIWLVPGSLYESAGGEIFNTAPVIDPDGVVIARYRKMFPWLPYEKGVASGREFVTFNVPEVGCFGVSICYDGWFPETTRALVWNGAEVILHPTMTNTIDRPQELVIAQANAIFNQCYFLDVNAAGKLGNGRSIVVGPEGEVLYQASMSEECIALTVDLAKLRQVRRVGLQKLSQPLKSFRDACVEYPCYRGTYQESSSMRALGPLEVPARETERRS